MTSIQLDTLMLYIDRRLDEALHLAVFNVPNHALNQQVDKLRENFYHSFGYEPSNGTREVPRDIPLQPK